MGSKKVYRTNTEQTTGFFRLLDIAEVAENREDLPLSLQFLLVMVEMWLYKGWGVLMKRMGVGVF